MEGPYTLEQINADIAAKKYKDSDYWAWYQGLTAWVPLYAVGGVCAATDTTLFFARPASAENPAPSHPPQPPASDTAFFLAAHAPGGAQGAGQLEACTPTPVVAAASKAAYSDPASEVCPFSDASTAGAEEVYANLENLEGNMDVALPEDGRTPAELSECAAPEAGGREPVAQVPAPEPTALAAIEPAPDPAQTANSSIADVSPAAPADPGNAEAPAPAESVAIQAALEIVNGAAHEPAGEQPQAQQPAAASPRKRWMDCLPPNRSTRIIFTATIRSRPRCRAL